MLFKQVITEATRVTKDNNETLVDHITVYTSCPSNVSKSGVICIGMSDHFSAYVIMNKENTCKFQTLKGVLHLLPPKAPKLACFVLYLKIINIFLKNNICIL